jgi:DNA mismatch repair protein MutS
VLRRLEASSGPARRLEELPLFAAAASPPDAPAASEVERQLARVDPDTLTPKEALELVYRLKASATQRQ